MQGGAAPACILALLMSASIAALNVADSQDLDSTSNTTKISNVFPNSNNTPPISNPIDSSTVEVHQKEEPNKIKANYITGSIQRHSDETNATRYSDKEPHKNEQNLLNTSQIPIQLTSLEPEELKHSTNVGVRRSGYEYPDEPGPWLPNQQERNELLSESQAELDALAQILGNKPTRSDNYHLSQSTAEHNHYTPEQYTFRKQSDDVNINYGESPLTSAHSLRAYNNNPIPIVVKNNSAYKSKNDGKELRSLYNVGYAHDFYMTGEGNIGHTSNVLDNNNKDTIVPITQITLNGKLNPQEVNNNAVVGDEVIQVINENQPQYILSQNQVDAVIQALNATFPSKPIAKASDIPEPPKFQSRVILKSDLIWLLTIPGAEKSLKCSVEGQFFHLTTPMGQCLVCVCRQARGQLLQPVCANCNGCPALTVTTEQQQKGVDACAPVPVGVTFEHPLNPCHVCVCLVVEGGSAHISCQPGPQCVTQKEVLSIPPECNKFPNNVEFPHPTDHCQMCICTGSPNLPQQDQMLCYPVPSCSQDEQPVTSTDPIAFLDGSLNQTLSTLLGTSTPTLAPIHDTYGLPSSIQSASMIPLLPFDHMTPFPTNVIGEPLKRPYSHSPVREIPGSTIEPYSPETTHTFGRLPSSPPGTRIKPTVLPQQDVTGKRPYSLERPLTPEQYLSPPYQKSSGSLPPAHPTPIGPFGSLTTGYPTNITSSPPYEDRTESTKVTVAKPSSAGGLVGPHRGPLLGPPPHESCAPFPPGEDFDHPWDVCQVCRCLELHSQGHIYIEINCNTKSECCVVPYAPEFVSGAESSVTLPARTNEITNLQILDKKCELKTLEVEWVDPSSECRVCACRSFGSYVVPACHHSPDNACTEPTDNTIQIIYLEPLCRYQIPNRSFSAGCKTCVCQAVFNYVIVLCQTTPHCQENWIENGIPADSYGAFATSSEQVGLLGPEETSQEFYPKSQQPLTPSAAEIRAIAEFLSLYKEKNAQASVQPLQNIKYQYNYRTPHSEYKNAFPSQETKDALNYNQAQLLIPNNKLKNEFSSQENNDGLNYNQAQLLTSNNKIKNAFSSQNNKDGLNHNQAQLLTPYYNIQNELASQENKNGLHYNQAQLLIPNYKLQNELSSQVNNDALNYKQAQFITPNYKIQNAFSSQENRDVLNYNQAQLIASPYTNGQQYNKIQKYSKHSPQILQQETYPGVMSNSYYGGSQYGSFGSWSPQITTYRPFIAPLKYRTRSGFGDEEETSTKSQHSHSDKNAYPYEGSVESTTWYGIPEAPTTTHAHDETSAAFAKNLLAEGGKRSGRGQCQYAGDKYHSRCQPCFCFRSASGDLYSICLGTPCSS